MRFEVCARCQKLHLKSKIAGGCLMRRVRLSGVKVPKQTFEHFRSSIQVWKANHDVKETFFFVPEFRNGGCVRAGE